MPNLPPVCPNCTFWQLYHLFSSVTGLLIKGGKAATRCGLGKHVVNLTLLMVFGPRLSGADPSRAGLASCGWDKVAVWVTLRLGWTGGGGEKVVNECVSVYVCVYKQSEKGFSRETHTGTRSGYHASRSKNFV